MPETPPKPNDNDERRLWFDYIRTLNERRLQASQRSGVTTYVLVATLIGLSYRFGPEIPQFVAQPGNVRAGIAIFVLVTVVIFSFLGTVAAVEMFCAGESEFRATPKSSEALIPFLYGAFALLGGAFICLDVWVAISTFSQTTSAKLFLLTNGLWPAANIAYPTIRYRQLTKKAKNIKNPLPKFSPFRLPRGASLPASALAFIWSILGAIALTRYLKSLPGNGLQPFKAAAITLIVIIIIRYTILRSIGNATGAQYFGLERDIVLNRMAPAEIRERYLRDLSGPDMAQWLDESFIALDHKEAFLGQELESARNKLKEISSISTDYQAERKQRAGVVIGRLRKALEDCISQYQVLTFQGKLFLNTYNTQDEKVALRGRFAVLDDKFERFQLTVAGASSLLKELENLSPS